MMKRILWMSLAAGLFLPALAQKKDFTYNFYGFVRGDLFYNSRANAAAVDGVFYLYPLDEALDPAGNDMNAIPNGSFYAFTSRVGLDVKGPLVGSARSSAKLETDFGGFSLNATMLRIRQAYVALDWTKTQVLIGQTWHPLSGAVMPDVLNLSTGAPFNPFNRSPMVRLQYKEGKVKWTAAAIWQLQGLSSGPIGSSQEYIKTSGIPEIYVGADYTPDAHWLLGAGVDMMSLKPRVVSPWEGALYKVSERMTAFTYEAHLKYTGRNYVFMAKSMLASAIDNSVVLGGYGVSKIDETKYGEQEYTPFRHSFSWVNFAYGTKWRGNFFAGYSKNLGTSDELVSTSLIYGRGLNMDQLVMVNPGFSYNLPHWKLGAEYSLTTAYYGTMDAKNGKVSDTHAVTNHRIYGLMVYFF